MAQAAVAPLVSGAGPGIHGTGCCSSTCVGGWTMRPWHRLLDVEHIYILDLWQFIDCMLMGHQPCFLLHESYLSCMTTTGVSRRTSEILVEIFYLSLFAFQWKAMV